MRFSVGRFMMIHRCFQRLWGGVACGVVSLAAFSLTETQAAIADEQEVSRPQASERSDHNALVAIFGQPLLAQNAANVCLETRELPAEQRFDRLSRWVLPGSGHSFRVHGTFRRPPGVSTDVADETVQNLDAYPESQWILSPARELIKTAAELGRLQELKQRIESFQLAEKKHTDAQTTLQTLVEIAAGDTRAVAERLEDRFAWERQSQDSDALSHKWADLLVLWSVAENPATAHLVTEELFESYPTLRDCQPNIELDLIHDYLQLLKGRAHTAAVRIDNIVSDDSTARPMFHFDTFSRVDAGTHGSARPLARFHVGHNGARKISGHELDYLAFRGPIAGDVEINCEVATRPGAFTELFVHGIAAQPVDGGHQISTGGFAKGNRQVEISPPLEAIESQSHLRVVVHDGVANHFFNGRPVFETAIGSSSAPWVALRSWRRTASEIRNLHLVGSAKIADSISLLGDASLSGWASYYDPDLNNGTGTWNAVVGDDETVRLVSEVSNNVRGSFDEDLLYYVRPISWDAQIQYEFDYQGGTIDVHPAFGRSVFLISPHGVRRHQLTDSKFEQSNLRPDNAVPLQNLPTTSFEKPNFVEGWNKAELRIKDNTLSLWLNGDPIARTEFPSATSRTFGLFHYRDQTHAIVRNVRLTGDWPNTLPAIDQQPLASELVATLDAEAAELPARFIHDFKKGMPPELFDFDGDETSMTCLPDGVQMVRAPDQGVRAMRVCAIINGDFDIVAGYKDLEISRGPATWHCGIGLEFNLDNLTLDRCSIHRRRDRMNGHHYVAFGQKETNAGGKTTWTGGANLVDESTAGRLRLVRRGTKVYGLHAIADSPNFRVLQTTAVPAGPIAIHGLRFVTDIGNQMTTSVTWTELNIRAQGIDLLRPEDSERTLTMLDNLREKKPGQIIDLTKRSLIDAGIQTTGSDRGDVASDERGVTVTVQGDDSNGRSTLFKSVSLSSDFDVQVDLEVLKLECGLEERASSEVVMQVRLKNADNDPPESEEPQVNEASIILRHKWNGMLDLRPRVVARARGGKTLYLPIRTVPVKMPARYRIAQHDQTLYFIYCEQGSTDSKIIATYPLDRKLNATSVYLWVIGGHDQHAAQVSWKKLQIHGSTVQPRNLLQIFPDQPSQP